MGTIADKLDYLNDTKDAIKTAIENKGVTVDANDTFRSYASKINSIPIGTSGVIQGLTNGTGSTAGLSASMIRKIPADTTVSGTSLNRAFFQLTNLVEVEDFDTSSVTNMAYMLYECTSLTNLNITRTSNVSNMESMVGGCTSLQSVSLLDCSEVVNFNSAFYGCTALTTLGGLKDIGEAYLTTQSSNYAGYTVQFVSNTNLTHDSLMNIINNLYDIATKGVATQKLQLGNTNLAKLSSAEISVATNKGWTVS